MIYDKMYRNDLWCYNTLMRRGFVMVNTKEYTDSLVHQLTAERKSQKITQQQIADTIGMKAPNITRVEACRHVTSLDVILKYADALGKKVVITIEDK